MTPEIKQRIEQIRRGEVPEGYKRAKLWICPLEWRATTLNELVDIRQGYTFKREYQGKSTGYWNYFKVADIGVQNSGRYLISAINKVDDSLIKKMGCRPFNAGSIVFPRVGAALLNNNKKILFQDSIVDDNVLVLSIKNIADCSNIFLYYLLTRLKLEDWCNSSLVPVINSKSVLRQIVNMPSITEQQKIAEILTAQDKVIELKEKLLNEKQRQKKYLMQQLLTGKKRLSGFNKVWNTVELGEIFDYIQPTAYLVKTTDYNDAYQIPVLTAGKTFILGYTNESKGVFTNVPVVIFDDFTTATKYVDFPFKVKSSAIKILTIKEGFNITFAYEAMQLIKFSVGGHERHWISKYSCITIDVPELKEQTAIAEIISTADREIELLQKNIEQEKQKKKALMQLLLTGIVRV